MQPKKNIHMKRILLFLCATYICLIANAATYSGSLPVLYIQTENSAPIESKEVYLNATYYLDAMGMPGVENIGSEEAPLTMEIRGRGNWTWRGFDKKPYRIKLTDKQALLGMKKSRHFALLAHADDSKGFMRNAVGFQLSRMIGLDWTSADQPLEVVLNGEYIGLYFLTETIRVDKDRVNITEQEDEEKDASNITGGWLVEIDNYDSDPHVEIKEGDGARIIFTYKSPEVLSEEQENFLITEMTRMNELIYGDKNSTAIWNYIDIDALARFYIVQELMDNYESFHGSCYLHRERGEGQKWKFGPVWDFGSSFNYDKSQYIFEGREHHMTWIGELCEFPVFMDTVRAIYNEFYTQHLNDIYTFTQKQIALLSDAALADATRWPQYGNPDLANRINGVNKRLREAAEWLYVQWNEGENPEYNPDEDFGDELALTVMNVWENGEMHQYTLSQVDSITFERKEGIIVKAKVPASWTDGIYVWIWGDGINQNEHLAKRQGEWYVFAHHGKELNIIFKNGKGWTGLPNQTEDIRTTRSACYLIEQEGEEKATATVTDCP